MNKEIAIRIEGISKKYSIGKQKDGSLRNSLGNLLSSRNSISEDFWALKNVSFDIQKGDVIGIIGKNGAGKSTLLKILSQITKPTKGRIEIHGRVASLLEVGTGFHSELTGRENIFLNGTILGMTRKEVKAKFDEIVDFSGVENFIDTPVKHYSSGMYVRLAFAVAANLEPEILIVDEVLAVGDADFQKKCLGKMKDVSRVDGRTVLFVSHDIGAINTLCNRCVLFSNGEIGHIGDTKETSSYYLKNRISSSFYLNENIDPTKDAVFKRIYFTRSDGTEASEFYHDDEISINFELVINNTRVKPDVFVTVLDHLNRRVCSAQSEGISQYLELKINKEYLVRGTYSLQAIIIIPNVVQIHALTDICEFTIIDNGSKLSIHGNYDYGSVFLKNNWFHKKHI